MGKIKLAQVFTDNMVLQRDHKNPVWGKATQCSKIQLEFSGQLYETESVNGMWRIDILPLEAGGPYDMTISSDCGDKIILKNILVGEVWVAGGQSNMEFILQNSLNAAEEIPQANYDNIRYLDVPRTPYEDENTAENITWDSWKTCTPENAGSFSAVAYYFAKKVMKSLNVPVGIIGCNWGGTSASCWVEKERLSEDKDLKVYLDAFYEETKDIDNDKYDILLADYNQRLAEYNKKADQFKNSNAGASQGMMDNAIGAYPWPPPMGNKAPLRPAGLYYTMLQKVVPYGIRGYIYYQGEGDEHQPNLYQKLLSTLIGNWREDWGDKDLPFIFVQLPFYGCGGNPDGESWPILREQQLLTSQTLNNTAMAVSLDCGEFDNIHPLNKEPVGERLALEALAKVYGKDVECSGPVYKNMEVKDNKIVLNFDYAEKGLTAKGGGELTGFTICGENGRFVKAKADIKGNTVVVSSIEVPDPVAVRYAWANYTEANLYNSSGLPAGPFRTHRNM